MTTPVTELEFLGLRLNSGMSLALPLSKAEDVRLCESLLMVHDISLRQVAKIIGKLNWAAAAVPYAQAHFRRLEASYLGKLAECGVKI